MRIFILGFMGVGKSTLGRLVAEQLSLRFLDFDMLLEEHQGMSISDIFTRYGEVYFRKLEHDLLREVVQTNDHFILSTGGGLPCFHHNLEFMNDHGQTIYLKSDAEAIANRLGHSTGSRPLIAGKSVSELRQYVEETLSRRNHYYAQASIVIDVDLEANKEANVNLIVNTIRQVID
ncbi:MAG: shikimate kinase [Saprospiraceae bacterium]|nr:shikimate kinase [Saprospiraceae bacterium]